MHALIGGQDQGDDLADDQQRQEHAEQPADFRSLRVVGRRLVGRDAHAQRRRRFQSKGGLDGVRFDIVGLRPDDFLVSALLTELERWGDIVADLAAFADPHPPVELTQHITDLSLGGLEVPITPILINRLGFRGITGDQRRFGQRVDQAPMTVVLHQPAKALLTVKQ